MIFSKWNNILRTNGFRNGWSQHNGVGSYSTKKAQSGMFYFWVIKYQSFWWSLQIMKHIQSTESQQSWSDDHVSVSSNDYQTSSKINKTETSKSSDDMEKDHGKTQNQPWPMLIWNMTFRIQRNIVIFDKTRRNRIWAIDNKSIPDCWRKCRRDGYNWRWWRKCKSFTYSNC